MADENGNTEDAPAVAKKTDDIYSDIYSENQIPQSRFRPVLDENKALMAKLAEYETKEKNAEEQRKKAALEKAKKDEDLQAQIDMLTSQAQEAETKAKQSELDRLRFVVGSRNQLPEIFINLLQGESEEDIEAHAKQLLEAMPKSQTLSPNTDAVSGRNQTSKPESEITDEEISNMAATYGVQPQFLKQYFEQQKVRK